MRLTVRRLVYEKNLNDSVVYESRKISSSRLVKDLGINEQLVRGVTINKKTCRVSFVEPYDTKGHLQTDGAGVEMRLSTFGPQLALDYTLTMVGSRVAFISENEIVSFTAYN
ncbi:MAG: hypothetical protein WAV41_05055 [Microgenomates group bacterium]